ncbi:MAG: hypothetical protein COY80_02860 [Candidatus Pacebacteria bacterium CG_4_10_14_0_8_um_filter_42_14]|nr:MAG: hypothetical protein COY80_02860 [Candidatus Pacebacteria bacterium CG_4_10_14_0_8_um_filter_42_14]
MSNKSIYQSAQKSIIFQDYIRLLRLLEKRPLALTQTGNLTLKEIDEVHKACEFDFYHRNKDGTPMFSIRSEDEVPYLRHLRQLAKVSKFATERKHKLWLSKKGKEFLQQPLEEQFLLTLKKQFFYCNWLYLFPFGGRREEVLEKLQYQTLKLLTLWLEHAADKWYDLKQMTENTAQELSIAPELRAGYSTSNEDLLTSALEWLLPTILEKFDLIELRTKKERMRSWTFTKIDKVKLTITGKHVLELFLEVDQPRLIGKIPANIPVDEIDKQINHMIKTLKLEGQVTSDDIKNIVYHSPKSTGSTDLLNIFMPFTNDQKQMKLVMETLQTAWNYSPHQSLNNLSPHQKVLEFQTGKKIKADKPNYDSTKTKAYELIADSLPLNINISSWGDNHWGVNLSHSYYLAEKELERIREQGEIHQAESEIEQLLKREPLCLPAVLDLSYIYRELDQASKANLLMEYAHKQLLQLFPEKFIPGKDTFPWSIHSNRPFLTFLLEYASYIYHQHGVKKSIPHLERMIELNPNDNQGVRGLLTTIYLLTGQPAKVLKLSEKFPNDLLPELAMGKVLALYKLDRADEAQKYYQKYTQYLKHLRAELLATTHQPPPESGSQSSGVLVGGPEEAWLFWKAQHAAWDGTKGVIEWLKTL